MVKTSEEIRRKAQSIVAEYVQEYPMLMGLPVRVSKRQTRAGGSARFRGGIPLEIVISYPYFSNPDNWDNLREVVTHEMAHCVAGIQAKHNPYWKSIHRAMGGTGKRCHTMTLATEYAEKKRKRRYAAKCSKCRGIIGLGPTQYKRYKAGQTYSHKVCPY